MNDYTRQKFPYFKSGSHIYLDNAATTQVLGSAIQAVSDALTHRGNPYRGAHDLAKNNQRKLETATKTLAQFMGADTNEIVFTTNTTSAINIVVESIKHFFTNDDELLVAKTEHHANLLPYLKLGLKIREVAMLNNQIDIEGLKSMLNDKTRIVALQHCSNVTGAIQPLVEIIAAIKKFNENIFILVDGAQAIAHIPVDVKRLGCDAYAFSGHKIYGPDNIGVLYIRDNWHSRIEPVVLGGSIVEDILFTKTADSFFQPEFKTGLRKLIGGTPNVSGALGLERAINFIQSQGFEKIIYHEKLLKARLYKALHNISDIKLISEFNNSIGIVAFTLRQTELNQALARYLNKNKIAIRFGSHCAFGSTQEFGTESIRVSLGIYNTEAEIDYLIEKIKEFIEANSDRYRPRLEAIKNTPFSSKELTIDNPQQINNYIAALTDDQTDVAVFSGHFLAIPDFQDNTFYPSIAPLLPQRLHNHLGEFGMTEFPLYTWMLGNKTLEHLTAREKKLLIVANDTTGFNELRYSAQNKEQKSVETYREEFMDKFSASNSLPQAYQEIMAEYNNSRSGILTTNGQICYRESQLRDRFQKFIRRNPKHFKDLISYTTDKNGNLELDINLLNDNEIKTCTFNTFNSKTGGKFCIAELTQLFAELFGSNIKYDYLSERVKNPAFYSRKKVFVIYSPAMCSNAVNKSFELFIKIFARFSEQELHFINIPLGPKSSQNILDGVKITHISNRYDSRP